MEEKASVDYIVSRLENSRALRKNGRSCIAKKLHCSPEQVDKAREILRNKETGTPKILVFDLETAPMRAYVWKRWKENISLDQTISEWFILAWSAKWLYSNEIIGEVLLEEEVFLEDDSRIVKDLWELINEADIVVAHNGKHADVPWINTRFIVNGLNPPKPYYIIDTCDIARKQFGFSSNKLDALAGYFGFPHKLGTDFNLWKRCMEGDQESLNYMLEYNKVDTKILEEIYLKLRPWIKNHPNVGNYLSSEIPMCSTCGSDKLEAIPNKYYYTSVGKYQLYRCKKCGAISRGRINLNKKVNNQTVSICH